MEELEGRPWASRGYGNTATPPKGSLRSYERYGVMWPRRVCWTYEAGIDGGAMDPRQPEDALLGDPSDTPEPLDRTTLGGLADGPINRIPSPTDTVRCS